MANIQDEMIINVKMIEMGWICPNCKCGVNPCVRRCKCLLKIQEQENEGLKEQEKTEAFVKEAAEKIKERAEKQVLYGTPVSEEMLQKARNIGPSTLEPMYSPWKQGEDKKPTVEDFANLGVGKVLKPEPDAEEVPYGTEYKIIYGEYTGLHGAYIRQEMGEKGLLRVIALFANSVQVKMYDDQIERVEDGIGEWSVTGK